MTDAAYLERLDARANMARFYRVAIEPDLFGGVVITRQWGRIGSNGRELRTWFADEKAAEAVAGRAVARKRRRGYQDGPARLPAPPAPSLRAAADHSLSWGRRGAMIEAGLC